MPSEQEYKDFYEQTRSILERRKYGDFDDTGALTAIYRLFEQTSGKHKDTLEKRD